MSNTLKQLREKVPGSELDATGLGLKIPDTKLRIEDFGCRETMENQIENAMKTGVMWRFLDLPLPNYLQLYGTHQVIRGSLQHSCMQFVLEIGSSYVPVFRVNYVH